MADEPKNRPALVARPGEAGESNRGSPSFPASGEADHRRFRRLAALLIPLVAAHLAADEVTPTNGLSAQFDLAINGHRCAAGEAGWPIAAGRSNVLTIRARQPPRARPVNVTLRRIQPDGRESRETARLTPAAPSAGLELGLFAVPAAFAFEAGVVYRRGSRFELEIRTEAAGVPLEVLRFHQTIDAANEHELLAPGAPERVVHFGGLPRPARPMDPPVQLSLAEDVLENPDAVRVAYRLRPGDEIASLSGRLRVSAEGSDRTLFDARVEVRSKSAEQVLAVQRWPAGRYRIELRPEVAGVADHEGPVITYRRTATAAQAVRLSPLAPWAFERDAGRPELVIDDFRAALLAASAGLPENGTWTWRETGSGRVSLVTTTDDWQRPPVVLRPHLRGTYAVFATTENGHAYVRVGRSGVIRGVLGEPTFVDAADLTGEDVAILPAAVTGSGLRQLRFVPVTAASVARVREQTKRPPTPLRAVADWGTYFFPPPSHHSAGGRLGADQLDALLRGHAEIGLSSIGWTAGRSWVEYHSRLPNTTRFPAVPLENLDPEIRRTYAGRAFMIETLDPLAQVLAHRTEHQLEILPLLAMQRHYGADAYGGIFRSAWFGAHPEWWRWNKGAKRGSDGAACFYFPEVRKERVDILCEVAERSPDGLVVDWCRQVPIALYHPKMVAEYRAKTGVDPLKIDASQEREYRAWIAWRAGFVTETLRELRARLEPIRRATGRPIPVAVRVPSKGFFYNLAQGLDVETWCREQLIAQIQLDPLEDCGWRGEPHEVRPYVELGRRGGVPVYGGVNGNTFWNYPALLRRALGLIEAGVAGIELYESSNFATCSPERWLVPLLGDAPRLKAFLAESNLDACFPIYSRDACTGYDNHSFRGNWSVDGLGGNSL